MSGLDKNQLAEALGVSPRSVRRWANEAGCPHWREGNRLRFNLDEVRNWRRRNTRGCGQACAGFTTKISLADAELARRITATKKNELALLAERGLKDLGLANVIRSAKTFEDLARIGQEVGALVASGELSTARGHAIQGLIAETRHGLKAAEASTAADEALCPMLPCSKRAYLLAKVYDRIVSDAIREGVTQFIYDEARRDLCEHPYRTPRELHKGV